MGRKQVAIFDSGVGGLPLLLSAMEFMPREDYLFYADSANGPYGNKSASEVRKLVLQSIEHLNERPLKALIVSCHTSSVVALKELQAICQCPVIGALPALKEASRLYDPRKILVVGSPLALELRKDSDFISNLDETDQLERFPMQDLVDFAEEFDFDSPALKRYLRTTLQPIRWEDYHSVVLTNSHFTYFKQQLRALIPVDVDIIDNFRPTLFEVQGVVNQEMTDRQYTLQCFLSGKEVANEIVSPYLNHLRSKSFFKRT